MPEVSSYTKRVLEKYLISSKMLSRKKDEPTIHVDEIAMRVASFYEKIRGVIDWKGEHLLKRGAIGRMLKRKIFSQINLNDGKFTKDSIQAEPLIIELIRSGHFPNDKINESKIEEVQKAIDKYVFIIKNHQPSESTSRLSFYQWLSSIAACEIEEILSFSIKERALISYMYRSMKETIEMEEKIDEKDKNILIYIAVQQALFDLDSQIIGYHLLKYKYKEWKNLSEEELEEVTNNIHSTKEQINSYLNHPSLKKIYQVCKIYNTPYLLIGDMLEEDPKKAKKIIQNPEEVESSIKKHYKERVKMMKSRLSRAAIYATISIFLTNVFALLAVEIPFTTYVMGQFSPTAIAIDIFVPTLLMAVLVMTIQSPPEKNEKKVVMETMKVIYKTDNKQSFNIKKPKEKKFIFQFVINFLYLLSFCLSVGGIIYLLQKINFPPLSYFIFIIFLSLIAFAGMKIRERGKELHMIESKDGFSSIIVDLFALPVIQMGKWFTIRWEKYNIISVFFSALIDMPFMVFVEFVDQWRNFLKEKKEEIY